MPARLPSSRTTLLISRRWMSGSSSGSGSARTILHTNTPTACTRTFPPFHHHHLPLRTFTTTQPNMGVTVESLSAGNGKDFPKPGDTVSIHYTGTLLDGSKFDSSRDRGAPFETKIGVGRVIKGWDEGVPQLSIGQKAILTCTPDYAYGPNGMPPVIPPSATLKFEVELIAINGKK